MLYGNEVGPLGPASDEPCCLNFASADSLQGGQVKVVLGHYPDYTRVAADIGANRFQIDENKFVGLSPSRLWTLNRQFLDQMYRSGAIFFLATPLEKARTDSWFDREIRYLQRLGATFQNS